MKKQTFTLILFLFVNLIHAQNPLVKQWDYRFGGTNDEVLNDIQQTSDGGFILCGSTISDSSGDVSQPTKGNDDFWIVKTDASGNKQWDKRFGGMSSEYLFSVCQTKDKGYILGGTSLSDSSGDVSQHSHGLGDYWIVKIDSLGNKQWDKRFGGTKYDWLYSLQQTNDGGYILGGNTYSNNTGDVSQPNWDITLQTSDYWVVKTDSLGNKQWDKRYGGIADEGLGCIRQIANGGYILAGSTTSDSSGDVSHHTHGTYDGWIIQTDSSGIMQWNKLFGGANEEGFSSVRKTYDGGYILGGTSNSDSTGDVSQHTRGFQDYWIVKIDSLGNKNWDKLFGGSGYEDSFQFAVQTFDHGYLASGTSYSPLSGDKTENNLASEQAWIVKTDSLGNKMWDKTVFTLSIPDDEAGFGIQSSDSCYVFANWGNSGIGGYKTQPNRDTVCNPVCTADIWFIKFRDTTSTTGINNTLNFSSNISIYPNPFSSDVSISINKQNLKQVSFILRNILGQTVFRKEENSLNNTYIKTIDLNKFAKGIYLLDIIIDGERTVKKIVKR